MITDVAIGDINLTDESMKRVNRIDDATIFSNQSLQSGLMAQSAASAMENAASNQNGAMMGFAGMNMAAGAASSFMGQVNQGVNGEVPKTETAMPDVGTIFAKEEAPKEATVEEENKESTEEPKADVAKFCSNCGTKATGNFCSNCGAKIG